MESAASAAEDMVDFALAGDQDNARTTLAALRSQLPDLRAVVGDAAAASIGDAANAIETALNRGDNVSAALHANEIFKTVVEAGGPGGTMPTEVSLLDYSGFRIKALASANAIDWQAIGDAVGEQGRYWSAVAPRIDARAVHDLMSTIAFGFSDALKRQDRFQMTLAAQFLLDTVDIIEMQIKGS